MPGNAYDEGLAIPASMTAEKQRLSDPVQKELGFIPNGDPELLENPLVGIPADALRRNVREFCESKGLEDKIDLFTKGAFVAQNPDKYAELDEITGTIVGLTQEDIRALDDEINHKWRQPRELYYLVVLCSMCAIVQGMDETVVNGAQIFYKKHFKLEPPYMSQSKSSWLVGLINSAPYLCCAVLGCWITEPLNNLLGRRGVIFLSCLVAGAASIWEGVANSWVNLFMARFVLGLGIGSKSTTVPVYAAECAPTSIRGALVMQWQVWTAFGIMLGYIVDVAFLNVRENLAWRLMLGSTVIAPIFVCLQVYFCPESPRWLIKKNRYREAFDSFNRIRGTQLQAARDLYLVHVNVKLEVEAQRGRNQLIDLFCVPRIRRATLASFIVMFMQQFCGVNVIAYYSSVIFTEDGGLSDQTGMLASLGGGIINWIFAIPAIYTIDTFGRRNLLLVTFPLMSAFLFLTGFSFFIEDKNSRLASVAVFIYLFWAVYSPGEGPVPFTYSAEAFPLYIRDIGMSWATATCWFFNFVLSITWPSLRDAFTVQGAFSWYASWCLIGWVLVFFFVPETKALSLEELDRVFSIPTTLHAAYQFRVGKWWFRKTILRQRVGEKERLYSHEVKPESRRGV
ncbi:putative polyol transporter 1 [Neolecta irregularis DAH-3]|uniref:Putative polyol transporter 1 n=1 Tax=Neolecta irregularis (strain DAH-3) TaxID=1198029 RepID=A0A1U7LWY2_NEOID|nr:putative polyol transporter 1 [Neolecta irregularis DAH-3]|eukprot:OLL27129.1 putative polyol transporter 1 [Neolecta irregularis DAH-3]